MVIRVVFIGLLMILTGCIEPVEAPTLPLSSTPVFVPEVKLPEYLGEGELEGHTWQVGDVTFSFQRGNHLLVRGGHLDKTMPSGAPGRYTQKDEELVLDVLERKYTGLWSDNELSLNENPGIYLGLTEGLYPANKKNVSETTEKVTGESNEN
jgi:hypothetical protein